MDSQIQIQRVNAVSAMICSHGDSKPNCAKNDFSLRATTSRAIPMRISGAISKALFKNENKEAKYNWVL